MTRKEYFRIFLARLPAFQAVFRAIEAQGLKADGLKKPILDLGCGDGGFAEVVLGKGKNLFGVDIDAIALSQAQKKDIYKKLIKASAVSLPFEDGQFESILSNSVLEHIPDLKLVLKEAARVLRSGGVLVLTAPSDKRKEFWPACRFFNWLGMLRLASRLGDWENKFFKHFHCWSGKRWTKELKKAGFRQVSYQYKASSNVAFLSDLLLIFAPVGFLEKRLFGRFLGWRKYLSPFLFWLLGGFEDGVKGENGCVIIVRAIK